MGEPGQPRGATDITLSKTQGARAVRAVNTPRLMATGVKGLDPLVARGSKRAA